MSHPLLSNSYGTRPQVVQDDVFPEGIVTMSYAEEARTLTIGTASGHLIRLNRSGEQLQRTKGFQGIRSVATSQVGNYAAVALEGGRLLCVDPKYDTEWEVELPADIAGLAISPFGSHIAVSIDSSRVHIVTVDKKEIGRFETPQRIDYMHFVHESPLLIASAEFGHLCCHNLNGEEQWNERIMNNVGAMAVTGDGKRILLAAFNHGIQVLNGSGDQKGSFQIDGVPDRVVASSTRRRFAATSIENRVYWLNFEGELLWACDMSADPIVCMAVDPMGDRLFLATQSSRLLQLVW